MKDLHSSDGEALGGVLQTAKTAECLECEQDFVPNAQVSTITCLDCSIDTNTMIIKRYTNMDGSVRHKKLLKRRQMLLGLKGAVPYDDIDKINQKCRGCGETFVTKASFKDRLNYCNYCQKLRLNMKGLTT